MNLQAIERQRHEKRVGTFHKRSFYMAGFIGFMIVFLAICLIAGVLNWII